MAGNEDQGSVKSKSDHEKGRVSQAVAQQAQKRIHTTIELPKLPKRASS
jgi:hypothetical protein